MLALPPTVSPLEILWTTITFIGTILAAINWYDAFGDLIDLLRSGRNGILLIEARGGCTDQAMILIALASDFSTGVLAMLALPGRVPDGDPSLGSFLSPWVMILGASALIYLSFAKKLRRKKLLAALRGQHEDLAEKRHTELSGSLASLHAEVTDNTRMTEHAAERADAAYHEANDVNQRFEANATAGQDAAEAGNKLMDSLDETGKDTNTRVRHVEDAVITSDKRLDELEADARDP